MVETNEGILGKYISLLYRQEQKHITSVMRKYALGPTGYIFLLYLYDNEGLNQRQLCKILELDEALATRAMKKLESLEYIMRERAKDDQRSYVLALTDKGRKIAPILKQESLNWWRQLTISLEPEAAKLLISQLKEISQKSVIMERELQKRICI